MKKYDYPKEIIILTETPKEVLEADEKMSSLKIAEITGKQHKNVLADIRRLMTELSIFNAANPAPKEDELIENRTAKTLAVLNSNEFNDLHFVLSFYRNEQNKKQPCILLNNLACNALLGGYDVRVRIAIERQWMERMRDLHAEIEAAFKLRESREKVASGYKLQCEALKKLFERHNQYDSKSFRWKMAIDNEARLLWFAFGGREIPVLRKWLSKTEMKKLDQLERTNANLILCGLSTAARRAGLRNIALQEKLLMDEPVAELDPESGRPLALLCPLPSDDEKD